jgi:hypothetical protein
MFGNGVGASGVWPRCWGTAVANKDKPETTDSVPEGPSVSDALARIVELARQDMRERGFTDEQIDVLLQRTKAPDSDR